MDKRWMIICVLTLAIMLLLTGCGQKGTASKKTGTKTAPASAADKQAVRPVENVTPINVDALPPPAFSLQYCNKRLTDIRNDLKNAQDNLADERDDLRKLQAEPKTAERDATIKSSNEHVRTLTNDVSSLQHGLQSMEGKCAHVTSSICAEFITDAQGEVSDQRQELLNEQKELDYIHDAKKQDIQRRKVALIERRINEWTGIVEELQTQCT